MLLLMAGQTIEIQLTAKERSLLLRYGYPFEQIEKALKGCESSRKIEIVPLDSCELKWLIGDLCYSINHRTSGATQSQLLKLCDRLEYAEKYGDGMLDIL